MLDLLRQVAQKLYPNSVCPVLWCIRQKGRLTKKKPTGCNYTILLPADTQVLAQMLIHMRRKMILQGEYFIQL